MKALLQRIKLFVTSWQNFHREVDEELDFGRLMIMDKELVELRHLLHGEPELAGTEFGTAEIIQEFLLRQQPHRILTGLGGCGLLAVFQGIKDGPQVLLRCDMDALPVQEELIEPYSSRTPGVSHKCGHDGHMAIMAGVARELCKSPMKRGSALLLFQPAEETGRGASSILEDPGFSEFKPDIVLALHNLPGFPAGSIISSSGPFAEASRGIVIKLKGRSSHAGEPLLGISPAPAVATLINGFNQLCCHEKGIIVTLIHAVIGEIAFGTSPESAVVMATLRAPTSQLMVELSAKVRAMTTETALSESLVVEIEWTEEFPPTVNSPRVDSILRDSAASLGLKIIDPGKPFPWSEDFGHFTQRFEGALFGLGAGLQMPPLHDPAYDFPDQIIETGVAMFMKVIERISAIEL